MSVQREHMWSAYLDGELSASEAAEFDQTLTPAEKDLLQSEVRFERALGDVLSRGGACPEDVWQRTMSAVSTLGGPSSRSTRGRWFGGLAAAAVALICAAGYYQTVLAVPGFLRMKEDSIEELRAELIAPSSDVAQVNDFLHNHGVTLTLYPAPEGKKFRFHQSPELLGASERSYRGEHVPEILYECCGKPVKLVILPRNSVAADAARKAIKRDAVCEYRTIGDYIVVVVGTHTSRGILDLLNENGPGTVHEV